uniref:Large ribosomal subunit protein uL22c n=1 Tax=Gastroclonium compressum TaxID=1852973 RepID=A0A173G063_GASCM|nr:ribosomal protein L22 [Coeloseira compressa]ANH09660.1 ribosomal protein L22 [Coeloseira compressa]
MYKNRNNQAVGKYIRISPQKSRRILDQIRGRECEEALLILQFMPHKSAYIIQKIIKSAINNSKIKNIKNNKLIIKEAFANEGPKLKRFQPRAQGRAFPIHKPTCHITIRVGV